MITTRMVMMQSGVLRLTMLNVGISSYRNQHCSKLKIDTLKESKECYCSFSKKVNMQN